MRVILSTLPDTRQSKILRIFFLLCDSLPLQSNNRKSVDTEPLVQTTTMSSTLRQLQLSAIRYRRKRACGWVILIECGSKKRRRIDWVNKKSRPNWGRITQGRVTEGCKRDRLANPIWNWHERSPTFPQTGCQRQACDKRIVVGRRSGGDWRERIHRRPVEGLGRHRAETQSERRKSIFAVFPRVKESVCHRGTKRERQMEEGEEEQGYEEWDERRKRNGISGSFEIERNSLSAHCTSDCGKIYACTNKRLGIRFAPSRLTVRRRKSGKSNAVLLIDRENRLSGTSDRRVCRRSVTVEDAPKNIWL